MGDRSFFLRVGEQLRKLEPGELVIGRSSKADVRLDDDMVSRQHCIIRVGENVMIEDLSSRNGVLVNGARVERRRELRHGDEITIGRHRLVLTQGRLSPSVYPPALGSTRDSTRPDSQETKTGTVYDMFSATAATALGTGDLEGAQRLASNLFVSLRAELARGQEPGPAFSRGVTLGLRLAKETRDGRWIDRVCTLYASADRVMAPSVVAELEVLKRDGIHDPSAVRRYVAHLQKRQGEGDEAGVLARLTALADGMAEEEGGES